MTHVGGREGDGGGGSIQEQCCFQRVRERERKEWKWMAWVEGKE